MKEYEILKAYRLIEPGPVILVVTADEKKANVMTVSWHIVMDYTPRIGCVIGPWDYSYSALLATKECVIGIPTVDIAEKVVDIGNCSGEDTDKFEKFDLTPLPAANVSVPLLGDCLANIECRVSDDSLVEDHSLFILEGVKAWIDPVRKERRTIHSNGDGTFSVDGSLLDLKQRMIKYKAHV